MELSAYRNLIERYFGRMVVLQTYGNRRFVGRAVTSNNEFLILQNAMALDEQEGSRWQDEQCIADLEDGVSFGFAEILIRISHIESIATNDETLPPLRHSDSKPLGTEPVPDLSDSPVEISSAIEVHCSPSLLSLFSTNRKEAEKGEARPADSIVHRLEKLRKELKGLMGFEIPPIRCRDSFALEQDQYQIWIQGATAGAGFIKADRLFAIHIGTNPSPFAYPTVKEPAFGLNGQWIAPEDKQEADKLGYTVVEPHSVLVTHVSEVLQRHRHELLSYTSLERSLRKLQKKDSELISDFFHSPEQKQTLHRVLLSLLEDHIWIGNLSKIAEAVSMGLSDSLSHTSLMTLVRRHITRSILKPVLDQNGVGSALVLCEQLQNVLHEEHSGELTEWMEGIFSWLAENSSHLTSDRPWGLIVPEHCRNVFARRVTSLQLPLVVVSQHEAITVPTLYAEKTILQQEVQAILEQTGRRNHRSANAEDLF